MNDPQKLLCVLVLYGDGSRAGEVWSGISSMRQLVVVYVTIHKSENTKFGGNSSIGAKVSLQKPKSELTKASEAGLAHSSFYILPHVPVAGPKVFLAGRFIKNNSRCICSGLGCEETSKC